MRSIAWDVYLDHVNLLTGRPEPVLIDTVWDIETDPVEVRRSLVGHDGYDPRIVVKRSQERSRRSE